MPRLDYHVITIDEIAATNIRAVADLTDITTTSRAPVNISVDGYPVAGAVGDYVLYVRVQPATAEEADG